MLLSPDLTPGPQLLWPEHQDSSSTLLLPFFLPASTMPPTVHPAQGRWQISPRHKSGYVTPMPTPPCCSLIRLQIESKMAALRRSRCPLFGVSLYPPTSCPFSHAGSHLKTSAPATQTVRSILPSGLCAPPTLLQASAHTATLQGLPCSSSALLPPSPSSYNAQCYLLGYTENLRSSCLFSASSCLYQIIKL